MLGSQGRGRAAVTARVALVAVCLAPTISWAQATPVAVLWREYETVRRQWRVERAELRHDLDRFREQRVKRRFQNKRKGR